MSKELGTAQCLVDKFKPMVNGYIGSSYITGTEFPEAILKNAQTVAHSAADTIIFELSDLPRIPYNERRTEYWKEVKRQIDKTE